MKKKILTLIIGCIAFAALTACGTKGSYTGGGVQGGAALGENTTEYTESLTQETDKQTDVTEPETEYNGKYWKVKTSDLEGTVDWVKVRGFEGELYIEYDGKEVTVPWATQEIEPGGGGSFYVQDVTGDGYEDLIGSFGIREIRVMFVYDLKNGKDLSPYYCKHHDLYEGLYTYEEYASQINAAVNPLLEKIGMGPFDMSNGECGNMYVRRGENDFFENNKLLFSYIGIMTANECEWSCLVEYDFTGGECKMRIVKVQTRYERYKEMLDVAGEYVFESEVSVESGGCNYTLSFKRDGISIEFFIDGNGSFVDIPVEYNGKKYDTGWTFEYRADKVYFELYDCDNDGTDELLYHAVMDGEDEVLIYEFEQ